MARETYNPLDKKRLGESVADALLEQSKAPLEKISNFEGAGIYAIYYTGDFEPWHSAVGADIPIYVGKAIPKGARKGGYGLDAEPGKELFLRLNEHARSIQQTNNLKIHDFLFRFLLVDDIWIPLGEDLMVKRFSPLWNVAVDGFGNHDPGKGRYKQRRSAWDTIHPGRSWAMRCQPNEKSAEMLIEELKERISNHFTDKKKSDIS